MAPKSPFTRLYRECPYRMIGTIEAEL